LDLRGGPEIKAQKSRQGVRVKSIIAIAAGGGFSLALRADGTVWSWGVNDKGLATYDRRVRKDAWYWYQANWSARPMLHLANRRCAPRAGVSSDIKAYTNLDEVALAVDGVSLGSRRASNRVVTWNAVTLPPGAHHLMATGGGMSDSIEWMVAAPTP